MIVTWVMLPIVGGLIGWSTNLAAIRMLFRPKKPIRFLGLHIQGVLPKRQLELARVIAQTVKNDLLPMDELLADIDLQAYGEQIVEHIIQHVDERLEEQLPSIIPPAMKRLAVSFAQGLIRKEAPGLIDALIVRVQDGLQDDIDIETFIYDKVAGFDVSQLEGIALKVASKELKTVEALGGVLGFFIGLVQALIVSLVTRV